MAEATVIALILAVAIGVGVESAHVADGEFDLNVPFQNWHARPLDCADPNYTATHWQPRPERVTQFPANCTEFYVGNECKAEPHGQCDATPQQVAMTLRAHLELGHEVWCCGSFWLAGGFLYDLEVIATYYALYGEWPALRGLHIHAYDVGGVQIRVASWYRMLADIFAWRIRITEYACVRATAAEVAACMPEFTDTLIGLFGPRLERTYWFIYPNHRPPQGWLGGVTDLKTADGEWTEVGKVWLEMVGIAGANHTVYMPGVAR